MRINPRKHKSRRVSPAIKYDHRADENEDRLIKSMESLLVDREGREEEPLRIKRGGQLRSFMSSLTKTRHNKPKTFRLD